MLELGTVSETFAGAEEIQNIPIALTVQNSFFHPSGKLVLLGKLVYNKVWYNNYPKKTKELLKAGQLLYHI